MAEPEITDDQVFEQAMAALRLAAQRQREKEPVVKYSIFLGNTLTPYDDDLFDKPGFAKNSLHNKITDMIGQGLQDNPDAEHWHERMSEPVRQRWWALHQAIRYRDTKLKKRVMDAAFAEGLVSIEPTVKIHRRREGAA